MTIKEQVLRMLEENSDCFISGEQMAKQLFVSRNAVWKAIVSLRAEGYKIEASTRTGYRLLECGIFSAGSVSAKLERSLSEQLDIKVVDCTGSTNTDLKAAAENGAAQGNVLIARKQTAGKGRLGRSFYSPEDTGLYMSILLRPTLSADKALFITTCAAAAVSEATDILAGVETKIKWVNDVYLNGKKICGILTEASMDFESGGLDYAVCGIGVNLSENDFSESLKEVAGAVFAERKDLRAELAAGILSRFFYYYDKLPSTDFLSEYRRRSLLLGKKISFIKNGNEYFGTAEDIDEQARLVVKLESGEITAISSGEATLRKGEFIK